MENILHTYILFQDPKTYNRIADAQNSIVEKENVSVNAKNRNADVQSVSAGVRNPIAE